jgi:hypothetical protein
VRKRAVILPEKFPRCAELIYGSKYWEKLKAPLSIEMSPKSEVKLRSDIAYCVNWLLTERARIKESTQTTAAAYNLAKDKLAPLRKVAKALRTAAAAWAEVGEIYDDRLSDIGIYKNLKTMACDAERRLAGIQALGKPTKVDDPWLGFVRRVYRACRQARLDPKISGHIYDSSRGSKPTWFHQFMLALNDELLGNDGKGPISKSMRPAFYNEINKAISGGGKSGKPRK